MTTPHIAIGDTTPRIQYVTDGTKTAFPFPLPIFQDDNLKVYLDTAVQMQGYTVTGTGQS